VTTEYTPRPGPDVPMNAAELAEVRAYVDGVDMEQNYKASTIGASPLDGVDAYRMRRLLATIKQRDKLLDKAMKIVKQMKEGQ